MLSAFDTTTLRLGIRTCNQTVMSAVPLSGSLEQNQRFPIKIIHVCARLFIPLLADNWWHEDRREPPTDFDRAGPRFVRQAAIRVKADSARTSQLGSD
jgi:hypothetical protein